MSTGRYLRGIQDHNNVAGDAFLAMLRSWPLEYIAAAGEELAKFAGFIDDKGLVGQLPQFQFTEYDSHNIRVTVVEGNCNQREAVPGRFFYEKLRNGVVKTFYFYAQCGAAHIMELL